VAKYEVEGLARILPGEVEQNAVSKAKFTLKLLLILLSSILIVLVSILVFESH
jgi:hypothetical protein